MASGFAKNLLDWVRAGIRLPLLAAGISFAAYAVYFANPYELRMFSLCGVYALLVLGFQFIFGYAGAVSLAQATFFGIGAYVTGILGATYGFEFPLTFPLSILLPTLLALVIAVPVLKLEEHYFALATMGIGLVAVLIVVQWQELTGGTNGLAGVPPVRIFGFEVSRRLPAFLFIWGFVCVGMLISNQVTRGLYGRAFHLMRESRIAAASLGIDVARLRFVAFLFSAAYGGAAGALMAHLVRVVSPENLELPVMVTCLTMIVVGGRYQISGAIVGAAVIIGLREQFRILENYYLMAYGAAALVVLILAPYGLVGAVERVRERLFPSSSGIAPAPAQIDFLVGDRQSEPLLELRDVGKSFGGVRAVESVSFSLNRGEIIGLIGPNGSGKTTLVNLISGLYRSDRGSIRFDGRDLIGLEPHRIADLGIARTFQHIHLADDMSVLDNIAVARFGHEKASLLKSLVTLGPDRALAHAQSVAIAAAELMGVAADALRPCGTLAYGTRRRVEVARALAAEPKLLLLDEPAAGLNEEEQRDFANRIQSVARCGVTILVIEHNLVFLRALATRMICLDRGRAIASGSPAQMLNDPAVIEAYLGTPVETAERGTLALSVSGST
ncbi:MAG: branched-chain amino acid ABC transporter ATP-binding protein/permease [Hyphomicrobiales bacterium]